MLISEHRGLERQVIPFYLKEIEVAVREIGKLKSQGPDGINAEFKCSNWNILNKTLCMESVSPTALEIISIELNSRVFATALQEVTIKLQ